MKKKTLLLGVLIIIALFFTGCSNEMNSKEASLLVVSRDFYFKSGASFGGYAIFDDGNVYTWYYSGSKSEYNKYLGSYSLGNKDGLKQFVLEKAKKVENSVSKSDLIQIKLLINKLKNDDVKSNCQENKKIYSTMSFYQKDDEIKLVTSDECEEFVPNETVSNLLSLVNKYIKKYINYTKFK